MFHAQMSTDTSFLYFLKKKNNFTALRTFDTLTLQICIYIYKMKDVGHTHSSTPQKQIAGPRVLKF